MSDINQDDIDKLLRDALAGDDASSATPPADTPASGPDLGGMEGAASQDDIDALFAAVGTGSEPPAPAPAPAAGDTEAHPTALAGPDDQDDIEALLSAIDANTDQPPVPDSTETAGNAADRHDDAPLESRIAEAEAQADLEASQADDDLNALFSSIAGEEEPPAPTRTDTTDTELTAPPAPSATVIEEIDMDELLRQVAEAAPPPPPAKPPRPAPAIGADTEILPPNVSDALASAPAPVPLPPPTERVFVPPPPPHAAPAPAAPRREFSVLYGAGEVESFANQINALLNSLSEKAHGYMQAWIAADSEAKELRARALDEERRRAALESEKTAMTRQLDDLRRRMGEIEDARVAEEEAVRTRETSRLAKIRELESRSALLAAEAETLKDELTRARNQATGVDIESRRARFEADRLKNEVESERMERLRVQRALENREKELQALQAQSSGQASSLFIDELHRLVRRLESELDSRSSGAHEALKQLDRLEFTDSMVPVVANLRASLLQALGRDADEDDALKSLGREASGIKGAAAISPGRTDMSSFETALSTYNLADAVDAAGTLLRGAGATTSSLMRKIYQCPALRRPEITDHLPALARLLEGLRTVQEAGDRSRGSESGDSEVFYVHMFDFLHNLVKLKLVNRMSGDIWRLFLDLRGRFSFVTSDKQWTEYRDNTLGKTNRP